jgi:hypothetical protein
MVGWPRRVPVPVGAETTKVLRDAPGGGTVVLG